MFPGEVSERDFPCTLDEGHSASTGRPGEARPLPASEWACSRLRLLGPPKRVARRGDLRDRNVCSSQSRRLEVTGQVPLLPSAAGRLLARPRRARPERGIGARASSRKGAGSRLHPGLSCPTCRGPHAGDRGFRTWLWRGINTRSVAAP